MAQSPFMIGVVGTDFTFPAQAQMGGCFSLRIPSNAPSAKKACFERAFGHVGPNMGTLMLEGVAHSGYTVLSINPPKTKARIIFDYIEDVSYNGLIMRISQLGMILTEAHERNHELQGRNRELMASQRASHDTNYWCRGSFDECVVCFENTYSRTTCGHHLCGLCLSQMMRASNLGGELKCPTCRKVIDKVAQCYGGDALADLISRQRQADSRAAIEISDLRQENRRLRSELDAQISMVNTPDEIVETSWISRAFDFLGTAYVKWILPFISIAELFHGNFVSALITSLVSIFAHMFG